MYMGDTSLVLVCLGLGTKWRESHGLNSRNLMSVCSEATIDVE